MLSAAADAGRAGLRGLACSLAGLGCQGCKARREEKSKNGPGAVSGVCCAPCCRGLEAPRVPPLQSRPGGGRPLAAAVWPGRWRRSPFCTGRRPAGFCAPGLSRASPGLRPQALQSLRSGCRAGRAPRAPAATLRPAPGLAQHLRRAADLQSLGGAAPRPRRPRRCRRAPMQARSLAPFHARRCERAGPTRKPQAAPRRPCRPLCTDKPPVGLHAPGWQGPPTSARQPLSRKRLPQLSLGPEAGSCAELRRARLFGSTAQQERGPGPPRGKARASACCLRDSSDAGRGLPSGLPSRPARGRTVNGDPRWPFRGQAGEAPRDGAGRETSSTAAGVARWGGAGGRANRLQNAALRAAR